MFYKISIKVRIFFRLLVFSAMFLVANQGGNRVSKVSSMLQKLFLLRMGQKLVKTKTMTQPKPWTLCTINLVAIVEDNAFCSLDH